MGLNPPGLVAARRRPINHVRRGWPERERHLRRDVREAAFLVQAAGGDSGNRRTDERLQRRRARLVIEARAHRDVGLFSDGDRAVPEQADTGAVDLGIGRVQGQRKRDLRVEHEWRQGVHGALVVVLGEERDARLPREHRGVGHLHRRVHRRGDAELLRELKILLQVLPRGDRQPPSSPGRSGLRLST